MERAATFGLQTKDKPLAAMPNSATGASVEAGPALLFLHGFTLDPGVGEFFLSHPEGRRADVRGRRATRAY